MFLTICRYKMQILFQNLCLKYALFSVSDLGCSFGIASSGHRFVAGSFRAEYI